MGKTMKIWLIAAVALLLIGGVLFGGAMMLLKWDFTKLNTQKMQTNTHEPAGEIQSILVETREADVSFLPSDTDTCRVVCYEKEKAKHTVEIVDGVLTIRAEDTRKWYDYIGFSFHQPAVTVYLPQGVYETLTVRSRTGDVDIPKEFSFASIDVEVSTGYVKNYASATGDVRIKTSTGDILTEGASVASLQLSVTTGRVRVTSVTCLGDVSISVDTGDARLADVTCQNLYSTGDTGDLSMKGVVAVGQFSIERDTGDVELERCDAADIFIKTSTGDVEGSLLSEKLFSARSNTGDVEVPPPTMGGRCEIVTDTGDIEIEVEP